MVHGRDMRESFVPRILRPIRSGEPNKVRNLNKQRERRHHWHCKTIYTICTPSPLWLHASSSLSDLFSFFYFKNLMWGLDFWPELLASWPIYFYASLSHPLQVGLQVIKVCKDKKKKVVTTFLRILPDDCEMRNHQEEPLLVRVNFWVQNSSSSFQ